MTVSMTVVHTDGTVTDIVFGDRVVIVRNDDETPHTPDTHTLDTHNDH